MLRESSFNLLQVRRWDLRFLEILPQQSQSSSVDLLCGVVDQVSLQPWHLSSGMLTMNTMTLPTLMQQNYTKRTWRLRACEFPRRNSSAVLRAGERCSTCKGLKKGRTCFIFALFSTLGLMIILILETMTISPKERQFTGCLILWLIRFCHWKQKHQLNLLNTRNYLPSDFFIPSSLFGVLYVVCLRQETTAKIQERTGHLPGLQRLSGSDGNWCLIIRLSKISSKKSNPTSIHLIGTVSILRPYQYKANPACCRTTE